MRIHLKLTSNTKACPFNYQRNLVGAFHKWLGDNEIHDQLSHYSMSWLSPGKNVNDKHLSFPKGATWFISSPDSNIIKQLIHSIQKDPIVAFGMEVSEVVLQKTPEFEKTTKFYLATPALIKRTLEDDISKQYGYDDKEVNDLMTETLVNKLTKAGVNAENVRVSFDKEYFKPKRKLITFNGIGNKANWCPVVIEGSPEAIAFAWDVGVGNSTGIGFGALK